MRHAIRTLPSAIMLMVLTACGGGHKQTTTPAVSISLTPQTLSVTAGQTQQFTAIVTGSDNTAVTYALSGSGCAGAACGSISASGLYTAPSPIAAAATVTVTATASADTSKTASATIRQVPVAVTLTPTTLSLRGADTQQFSATVTGYSNTAVTWTVAGGGSVSDSGLYTAPYAVPEQVTATITATSQFDTTKSASASVTLTPLAISISPAASTLYRAKTAQFTATVTNHSNTEVTWSATGGSVDSNGLFTAPDVVPDQVSVTVTATSKADTTKVASAGITLLPLTVAVTPGSGILYIGQRMQFVADVRQSDDVRVEWTLAGAHCSGSSCGSIDENGLYTAPANVTPVAIARHIPGSAGPWVSNGSLNAGYPFGAAPGSPVVFSAQDGLSFTPGARVTISYVSGMWCVGTYVSASTCRDANGYPDGPLNDVSGGAWGSYAPSKYMDPSTYPVVAMELSGVFADSKGQIVGKPFAVGNGPRTVAVPDGASQLQLGSNDWDYVNARDYYTPLQAQVAQALTAVTVTATSTIDRAKIATGTVTVTDDPNAKLSGSYAFLFQGPGSSGSMAGMLGHFVADGSGKIAGETDTNAINGSPAVATSFTGTYSIGADDRGVLTFDSLPGSPSFRFAVGDLQEKEYAVEIDQTGSHLAGYMRKQHLWNLSQTALAGNFAFGLYGSSSSGEYRTVAGRMTLDAAGAISAAALNSSSDPSADTFSGTVIAGNLAGTGRGSLSIVIPGTGSWHGSVIAVDMNRLFFMTEDQTGANLPFMVGELRRQSGTFSAVSLNKAAVFYYTGITGSRTTITTVGVLAPGASGMTGEFDTNNNGSVLLQQPLTATTSVDASGRAVLNTSVLGQMVVYLIDDASGYLFQVNSSGLGMLEEQSFPQGGLTMSCLQGHKTCGGTGLPYPYSGGFACTMTWNASGAWSSVTDSTSSRYGNHIGMIDNGQITLDPATGRFYNTMLSSAFHHMGYVISPGKLAVTSADPVNNNEGVLWQAMGFWER